MKESAKKIRSFIRPGKALRITLWVLFASIVALALAGGYLLLTDDVGAAVAFDPTATADETLSRIDAVGVSSWLYKRSGDDGSFVYCAVEDAEERYYIAIIDKSDYDEMTDQREYWKREDDSVKAPEAVQLVGYPEKLETRYGTGKDIANTLGLNSGSEFESVFGSKLLNCHYTTPNAERASYFLEGAALVALLWLIIRASNPGLKTARKSIAQLQKRGLLDSAADELTAASEQISSGKLRCVVTDNYIFIGRYGLAIPRENLLRVEDLTQAVNFVTDSIDTVTLHFNNAGKAQDFLDKLVAAGIKVV